MVDGPIDASVMAGGCIASRVTANKVLGECPKPAGCDTYAFDSTSGVITVSAILSRVRNVMRSKVVGGGGTERRISAAVYRLRNFGGRTSGGAERSRGRTESS